MKVSCVKSDIARGCGTEIFCDVVSAGERLFYLSEEMESENCGVSQVRGLILRK